MTCVRLIRACRQLQAMLRWAPRMNCLQAALPTTRMHVSFFFFQAEDGIRDYKVTGVQTCALPISRHQLLSGKAPAARGIFVALSLERNPAAVFEQEDERSVILDVHLRMIAGVD